MKALVFHKPKHVRVEEVPEPELLNPRDAIVRVSAASICGSDLHLYNGYMPQKSPMVLGHEFMGVVERVGARVESVRPGDRVVAACLVACGRCFFCLRGLPAHCERSNVGNYGPDGLDDKGGGVFGLGDAYGRYDGGQAELVRVPWADSVLRKIPASISDESALFLTDIIPTGWTAAEWCGIEEGDVVAVFGCGPVGLVAMKAARLMGASRVVGVDILDYRRRLAESACRAETLDPVAADAVEAIRQLTGGRGADACVDAVGIEADHSWGESMSNALHRRLGSTKVLRAALRAVRRGGAVSMIGMYSGDVDGFPLGQLFEKGLTLKAGAAPCETKIDELLPLVAQGKLRADDLVTHRLPLEDAPRAYKLFNDKLDGCVKVVLRPGARPERVPAAQEAGAGLESPAPVPAVPIAAFRPDETGRVERRA